MVGSCLQLPPAYCVLVRTGGTIVTVLNRAITYLDSRAATIQTSIKLMMMT